MIKIGEIIELLASVYPLSQAMPWDNPGLQVGRMESQTEKVYVALDATDEVIDACIRTGAQLLVTHHPLLMSGIKKVNEQDLYGKKILKLAENKIAHYAIHTNYDVTEMAKLAREALGLQNTEILEVTGTDTQGNACGIGAVGVLDRGYTAGECCELVKRAFGLENVRLFGRPDAVVERIAVSPGSGKSMIAPALAAGVSLLITGDIGHHEGLDALDQGMMLIDAGHYGMEHIFIQQMTSFLQTSFPQLQVEAAKIQQPFTVL